MFPLENDPTYEFVLMDALAGVIHADDLPFLSSFTDYLDHGSLHRNRKMSYQRTGVGIMIRSITLRSDDVNDNL